MKNRGEMQAVLFDMDGTLINSEPYWLIAEKALMLRFGHIWSDNDQAFCLGGPLPKVGAFMSQLSGFKENAEYFEKELVRIVAKEFENGLHFMPGAKELVEDLVREEMPMALVSASPRLLVDGALALLPQDTFRISISNQDVKTSKPNPESYLTAADLLGVDIRCCLVLEDSKTGIDAGLASGAVVIGIPHIITYPASPRLHIRKDLLGLNREKLEEIYVEESRGEKIASRV